MMNKINLRSNLIVFGVPLLLVLTLFLLTKSSWFINHPKELSIGIILDLLITIPLVYFFIIRKKEIPKITIVSLILVGLVIASYILPENHQTFLSEIRVYIFPIIELCVLVFLFIKIRSISKEFKKQKTTNLDFFDTIQNACKESFPNIIATLLTTEIAVIYYGFFLWKKRKLKENEFTNYKEGGLLSILVGLLLVIFIETYAIHKFLVDWSLTAAWVLTATSIYTTLQIFALIKSLTKRPFVVDVKNKKVVLRFGFFGKANIPFQIINEVVLSSKDLPEDKSIIYFSPLGSIGGHNVILYLKKEVNFEGFYGFKKQAKALAISVDQKNKFIDLLI